MPQIVQEDLYIDDILLEMYDRHLQNPKKGYSILDHKTEVDKSYNQHLKLIMLQLGLIEVAPTNNEDFLTEKAKNIMQSGGWVAYKKKQQWYNKIIKAIFYNKYSRGAVMGILSVALLYFLSKVLEKMGYNL